MMVMTTGFVSESYVPSYDIRVGTHQFSVLPKENYIIAPPQKRCVIFLQRGRLKRSILAAPHMLLRKSLPCLAFQLNVHLQVHFFLCRRQMKSVR